ncbi:hypothetical protein OT109_08940 [Phycisphaeraceae bacterium D3-23]
MQHVARQLEHVRRTSRLLLIFRRVAQWVAVLVAVAIVLGLIDYALRLPGVIRLGLGLIVLGLAGVWLLTRVAQAYRFWPTIAELALRAERLYPQLSGSLASAVAFSTGGGEYEEPRARATTATMAKRAVDEAASKLDDVDLNKLIKPKPTLKAALLALLALTVMGTIAGSAPAAASTAAQRWLMPLGEAQWPKRNAIESLTDDAVRPVDGMVRLRAKVTQGLAPGMKMEIAYRVVDAEGDGEAGEWMRVRVAEQRAEHAAGNAGVFETLVEVPPQVARSLMAGERDSAVLEYTFTAGDFTTEPAELTLAARPEVVSVVATITPPGYAQGLLREQTIPMHEQQDRIATASAYMHSDVTLRVEFNKSIPTINAYRLTEDLLHLPRNGTGRVASRWVSADAELFRNQAGDVIGFTLQITELLSNADFSIALTDAHGLTSTDSDRLYRLQVLQDEAPTVVLLEPMTDETVLPTARVLLKAMGEDDIAMESLALAVVAPDRANTPEDAEETGTQVIEDPALFTTGRSGTLELEHTLDLSTLDLLPGDEVFVTAVGQDIFEIAIDGSDRTQRHDLVQSQTRRLRIITEQELADQARRVLRGVRDTAQSLERTQRILRQRNEDGMDPAETAAQQGEVSRRVAAQREQVDALRERLERNGATGLDPLEELIDQADGMLDAAQEASEQAQRSLDRSSQEQQRGNEARQQAQQAEQQGEEAQQQAQTQKAEDAERQQQQAQQEAGESQEQVQRELAALVAALDVGESIGEVESELSQLQQDAERVADDTRELLPQTVGQEREELPEDLQEQLDRNARNQQEIAERAAALLDKMRSTAGQIAEQGEQQATPQQRAAARTMQEAAEVGERQGLEENTEQAAQELEENQITDAATRQQQAQATLEQMLAEMGRQQQRQQEELRRLLQELAEKVQKLVDEQEAQLANAAQAQPGAVAILEAPLMQLRRRTMLVEQEAAATPETDAASKALGQAVSAQAQAVRGLRANDKGAAEQAETEALAHLREALRLLNEEQQEQEQEQQRQERAALKQAYTELAERQQALHDLVAQHERGEAYGRRDWRQVNALHEEALEGATFDAAQEAIRVEAEQLSEQAGEAMVYQSMHRRIDQASGRAYVRLRERRADGLVLAEQARVAALLRAMAEALEDTGDPDKFEREQQEQEQQTGEGEGGESPPPLVPDLAQVKLLREVQIDLRRQTEMLDRLGDQLTPAERAQRLQELSAQQRELGELGAQLIEKLEAMMGGGGSPQPPTPEVPE